MAEGRSIARPIIAIVCIGVTVFGLINVYGDNADVVAQAESVACGAPSCSVQMTRMSRSPITQSFTFQINPKQQASSMVAGSSTTDVECTREYFLLGEYQCKRARP
jgi:hypothetical protein